MSRLQDRLHANGRTIMIDGVIDTQLEKPNLPGGDYWAARHSIDSPEINRMPIIRYRKRSSLIK